MAESAQIPRDLRVVAYIHLVLGIGSLAEFVGRLTQNHFQVAIGILGIPICFGLLRLSRGWRTCALVLLWIGLLVVPVALVLGLVGSGPATFGILGIPVGQIARGWFSALAAAVLVLVAWQLRVLVRPGVRQLFSSVASPANLAAAADECPEALAAQRQRR